MKFWGLDATAWTAIYTLLTLGLLLVAAVAAVVAWGQWKASREQVADARRAAQEASRPYVIVSAVESRASKHLFDLSIHNMGERPAFDVKVDLDPPPRRARETHDEFILANIKMLKEPIAMLAPRQEMRTFWDNHIERNGRDDLPTVHHVEVHYKDSSGRAYNETSVIDLDATRGALFTNIETIHTIGKTLDDLAKHLKQASVLGKAGELDVGAVVETRPDYLERKNREAVQERADMIRTQLWAMRWVNDAQPGEAEELETHRRQLTEFLKAHPELATEEDFTAYGVSRETVVHALRVQGRSRWRMYKLIASLRTRYERGGGPARSHRIV